MLENADRIGPATISLISSSMLLFSHRMRGQDHVAIMHDRRKKAGAEMIPFHAE